MHVGTEKDILPITQRSLTFRHSADQNITNQPVDITVIDDTILEMNDTFFANLSLSTENTNVEIIPSIAEITIENDDSKF